MEKRRIVLHDIDDSIKEFLNEPRSVSKNIKYYNSFSGRSTEYRDLYEDDEKLCVGSTYYKLKRNGFAYYLKKSVKHGFTYNKKTQKVSFWYGASVNNCAFIIKEYFNHEKSKYEWFLKTKNLENFLTKTGLEKMISGKITNPLDYCRHYLKINKIKASPKLFYLMMINGFIERGQLFQIKTAVKNVDNYFKFRLKELEPPKFSFKKYNKKSIHYTDLISRHIHMLNDTMQQANILGVKINPNWSYKRLLREHNGFTKILMDIEVETLGDYVVDYKYDDIPKLPDNIRLLKSKKEVFIEGKRMKHCIYTNYWNDIKNKDYIVFSVICGNEYITVGCRIVEGRITTITPLSIGNSTPSEDSLRYIDEWLNENKNSFLIRGNYSSKTKNNQNGGGLIMVDETNENIEIVF